MIIFDRSAIIAGNPRFESPIKVRGSKTYLSDGPRRWVREEAKKSFLRGEFCRTKTPIFRLFRKFAKLAILIGKYLRDNGTYRKNGVYHDEQHGKTKKIAISDFLFSKLCHRDFCETFSMCNLIADAPAILCRRNFCTIFSEKFCRNFDESRL